MTVVSINYVYAIRRLKRSVGQIRRLLMSTVQLRANYVQLQSKA